MKINEGCANLEERLIVVRIIPVLAGHDATASSKYTTNPLIPSHPSSFTTHLDSARKPIEL